jgi:hypothetical protein
MPDLLDTVFEAIENSFQGGTSTAPPSTAPNKPSWFAGAAMPPPVEEEKDLLDTVFGAIENGNCPVPPPSSSSHPTEPTLSSFPWEAFQTRATSSNAGAQPSDESPKEQKTKKNKKKRGWENKWETIGFFHNPMAPSEEHVAQQKIFDEQAKRQKELEEQLTQKERELRALQQQQQQFRAALLQQQSNGGGDVDLLETVFSTVENGVCPNSNHAAPLMIAADQQEPRSTDPLPLLHPRRDHEPQFHGFVIHKLRQDYKSLADALDSGMSTVSSALMSRKSNQRSTAPESISVVKVKKNKSKYNNNSATSDIPRLPEKDDGDVIDQIFESFEAGMGLESSADALYKAHVALALQAQQEVALYKALVLQQQEEEKRFLKEQKEQQRRMEQEQVRVTELETRTEAAADEPQQHQKLDLLDSVFEAFELNLCAASTGTTTAVQ